MKILHIVPSYKPAYIYGGTIGSVSRLCEGLSNAGYEVTVFTTTANGDTELDVKPGIVHNVDGVDVIYFRRIFKDPFYISPDLSERLKQETGQYDVVHIHSWWNMLVMRAAAICKKQKINYILSPHGMMSDYILNNSKSILKKISFYGFGKSLLKSSVYHATSVAEAGECEKLIPGWKGFTIPNIVWLPAEHIEKKINDRFTIIFLSRIHPKKGIELLLEAISRLQVKPFLRIAGDGDDNYISELKSKTIFFGIENDVEWIGWQNREEKFHVLAQADLFALTSYNENFGNTVIESLYVGTPVLISDVTGLSDFVKENDLGWVCSTVVEDITLKIHEAMQDKMKRKTICKNAPAIVAEHFSEEKLIPEYIRHYRI
ncbi:MAG: glycosyltransferase [Bacteroidetes bacterium]|nr:glycosyltransferase [Bacteroidota bacterium]